MAKGRKRKGRAKKPAAQRPMVNPQVAAGAREASGPTRETVAKFGVTTIDRLIQSRKIGGEELRALEEIEKVYMHICAQMMVRGAPLGERLDGSPPVEPVGFVDAFRRYKTWADEWSRRWKLYQDPTLQIVFDVMFGSATMGELSVAYGYHHRRISAAFVNGVRDYAARAGFVDRRTGEQWIDAARDLFAERMKKAA